MEREPYTMFNADGSVPRIIDESKLTYQVEIHYSPVSSKAMKSCILTNADIDELVARYGCRL